MSAGEIREDEAFAWALSAVPMSLACVDCDYCYLAFNDAHAEKVATLYGEHCAVGRSFLDCVSIEADRASIKAHLDRALAGVEHSDEVWRGAGVKRRHYTTRYAPVFRDGHVIGATVVALDTTEQTRARQLATLAEQAILNAIDAPAYALDKNLRYPAFNDAWAAILEGAYGTIAHVGDSYLDTIGSDIDREEARQYFARILKGEALRTSDWRGNEGARRHWTATRSPIWDDGEVIGIVAIAQDTTDTAIRHQENEERAKLVAEKAELLDEIVASARDALMVVDLGGVVQSLNRECEQLGGYSARELVGAHVSILAEPEQAAEIDDALARSREGSVVKIPRARRRRHDGETIEVSERVTPVRDGSGNVVRVTWSWQPLDVSALFDPLTGLCNRRGLMQFGTYALAQADRVGERVALLYADLDDLKEINDDFGHSVGDIALRDVAKILRTTLRDADVVSRPGGDEFAVVMVGGSASGPEALRDRLAASIANFNEQSERPYTLSVSYGLASSIQGERRSLNELIEEADAAMYAEKRRHRQARLDASSQFDDAPPE